MIKKSILAMACSLPLAVWAQDGFTVQGKVGKLDAPAKAYLSYRVDGKEVEDSALLHKGRFSFTGKLPEPAQARIIVRHDTAPKARFAPEDDIYFYLENSVITVTAVDSISRATIKGSVTEQDNRTLQALIRPYKRSADSLVRAYKAMTPEEQKDSTFRATAGAIMATTQAGYDSVHRAFIAAHPNSYISLLAFKQVELAYNFNPDTASVKFARFPDNLKNTDLGKKLAVIIEKGQKTNTGVAAMDFTQKDTTGKSVSLSDFRGHYVLVDFWASWCKPCRAENPNLLAAYKKFKDHNFTILGVSLDDSATRKAWLHAVKQDGLPWTQVSELKGFQSKAAVLYGVTAIPSNFLIDPKGKIIARNLRGEELEKELETLFSKQ